MRFIAMIITPLQYINLLEIIEENKEIDSGKCVVFLIGHTARSMDQIEEIGHFERFERVLRPMMISRSTTISFFNSITYLHHYSKRVPILGNLDNLWCRSLLKKKQVPYVLDDGAASVNILNNRKNRFGLERKKYTKNKLELLIRIFLRPPTHYSYPVKFFTAYEGMKGASGDTIDINKYACLRKTYSGTKREIVDECWFIGAPLARMGYLSAETYCSLMEIIFDYFDKQGLKFRYFGHRSEIAYELSDKVKFEQNTQPFEMHYLSNNVRPKVLASFFSSCLRTIEILDGDVDILSFSIPESMSSGKASRGRLRKVDQVYEYFLNNTRIRVIKNVT